ncbi:hypothetical protein TNCV_489591 [Trichonephila clavipes]|nr:hypothetical protein TNCV_489591 [Trichonephila clavipes]
METQHFEVYTYKALNSGNGRRSTEQRSEDTTRYSRLHIKGQRTEKAEFPEISLFILSGKSHELGERMDVIQKIPVRIGLFMEHTYGRDSLVVKITDSLSACRRTAEDPSCSEATPVGMVWKLGEGDASSDIVLVT